MNDIAYTPVAVDDLDMAFGVRAVDHMPPMSEIPAEYSNPNSRDTWVQFQRDWFFKGLGSATFVPQDGIDKTAALRHLKMIQASWEPKHEHKEAAVAYLASLWFKSVTSGDGKVYGYQR